MSRSTRPVIREVRKLDDPDTIWRSFVLDTPKMSSSLRRDHGACVRLFHTALGCGQATRRTTRKRLMDGRTSYDAGFEWSTPRKFWRRFESHFVAQHLGADEDGLAALPEHVPIEVQS